MIGSERQFHINCKQGDVGRYCLLPGDPGRCEKIARYFENPVHVMTNREYVTYTGTLLGEKVSVTSTGIGGPSASIAMEELANLGADTFVRVGTCGGIKLEVTSYGQHSPDRMPVSYELQSKWEAWKRLGVLASEMESAALFTVAAHRGVRCGSAFHVIWNQERNAAGLDQTRDEDTESAIRVGIEAVKLLIQRDRASGR
ncbi:MAG: nucleoside phosphorylase [Oscillospiraceae bacterium]|nr:nucleoside phosphorylase [Oscillospiraceae bacterium]